MAEVKANDDDNSSTDENYTLCINITSDFACPWCYVGYVRFNNALRAVMAKKKVKMDDLNLDIRWHPYMIDMKTAKDGEPFLKYNERRWGSDGWFTYGCKKEAQNDGATFAGFGRENAECRWANTLNAHRFMWFFSESHVLKNGQNGLDLLNAFDLSQHELKRIMLRYYYERGVNISTKENLIVLAKELGMDNKQKTGNIDFIQFLNDEQNGKKEVLREDRKAKNRGIGGVPYFEVSLKQDGKEHALGKTSGAQPSAWWVKKLDKWIDMIDSTDS